MSYLRNLSITLLFLALILFIPTLAAAVPGDIAVYFGSFDPPHNGHLAVIRGALPDLGVDEVLLVPTRGEGKRDVASFEHRLAMCQRMARFHRGVGVISPRLLERAWDEGGRSSWRENVYRALYKRLKPGSMVLDLIGMDRFNQLLQTRRYPRKDEPRMVIVVDRPGHPLDTDLVSRSGVSAGKFLFLHPEVLDIQSEKVRARLASGRDTAGKVPLVVRRYIRRNGLYR